MASAPKFWLSPEKDNSRHPLLSAPKKETYSTVGDWELHLKGQGGQKEMLKPAALLSLSSEHRVPFWSQIKRQTMINLISLWSQTAAFALHSNDYRWSCVCLNGLLPTYFSIDKRNAFLKNAYAEMKRYTLSISFSHFKIIEAAPWF